MKFLKTAVLLVSFLALTACGNKPSGHNNQDTSNVFPSSVPVEHSTIAGNIGADGGEVKDPENNVTINVPAGALNQDTPITATYIESHEILTNSLSSEFLGAVEFGPSGTVFNKPVSVTVNLTKVPKNSSLAVFCYYEADNVWEYVTEATPSGQKATFEVTHFSKYQIMDRTKDFLNEYTNIVKHAKANGLSDAEITEAFRDYLVNNQHVMDQYTTYNGYWYEPCGLKINGNYQIDNQKGDPNDLTSSEGESNKVGDTYGLCQIDGGISNRQEKKNASEGSEVIDVLVIVEYKIIQPDIDLSASKTQLNKGESATVNVRCHYVNVSNFYSEYKDLELGGYFLTIAKPTNFSVDKSSMMTDGEGEASFVVTAKEDNKAETITVSFDVAGEFGTHAEGNITLNSTGGYQLSGHIKEEFSVTYSAELKGEAQIVTIGSANVTIGYDFSGSLTEAETGLAGSINFSNVTASISNSIPLHTLDYNPDGSEYRTRYNLFSDISRTNDNPVSYPITATVSDNECAVNLGEDAQPYSPEIGPYAGSLGFKTTTTFINGGYEQGGTSNLPYYIELTSTPLLPFSLTKDPQTTTVYYFKDSLRIVEYYLGELFDYYSVTGISTVQTITVE